MEFQNYLISRKYFATIIEERRSMVGPVRRRCCPIADLAPPRNMVLQ